MIIDLPKKFKYRVGDVYCYINSRGYLAIKGNISFSKVMKIMAYQMNDYDVCPYCGRMFNRRIKGLNKTIDHIVPVDRGGITVTNNLMICCEDCNIEKNNMDRDEYMKFISLEDDEKYVFLAKLNEEIEKMKYSKHLLKDEFVNPKNTEILLSINFYDDYKKAKKYQKIKKTYKKYGNLLYPVVVDRNNTLLDGFFTLIYSKREQIQDVPIIRIDNVERK